MIELTDDRGKRSSQARENLRKQHPLGDIAEEDYRRQRIMTGSHRIVGNVWKCNESTSRQSRQNEATETYTTPNYRAEAPSPATGAGATDCHYDLTSGLNGEDPVI